MRRRIYVDGKPDWSPNEPDCRARTQGFGGAALGAFTGTTLAMPPPRVRIPRAPQNRVRRICGIPLRLNGGPCVGILGHRGHHRSALAQANRAVGRRA